MVTPRGTYLKGFDSQKRPLVSVVTCTGTVQSSWSLTIRILLEKSLLNVFNPTFVESKKRRTDPIETPYTKHG